LSNGSEVWVDSENLMADKPVHLLLSELRRDSREYRQTAEAQIKALRDDLLAARELAAASERLQKRIAQLELDNESLTLTNQTLSDRSRYDLLTAGGLVAIVGIFIGLILPRLIKRRRDDGWR
jgi:SH3 domain protein